MNLSQLRSYGSALAAVAVVLTTRVTGDLRLLRILVIDQPCDGGGFELLRRIGCGRPGSGRRSIGDVCVPNIYPQVDVYVRSDA